MSVLEVKNLSKSYSEVKAVKDISITVNKGEIVGFVGKNGAGKSTTIRSILNIINQNNGTISINGLDSIKDSKEIKKQISYVPSEISLYENLTSREVLEFALGFIDCDKDKMIELAKYFELNIDKKISELSFGNKKKVSLVLALLNNSSLIILDEPTNGLDPLMQKKFFDYLLNKTNKTVLMSSHNLNEIKNYCDVVIVIKDGEIVDKFTSDKMTHNSKQVVVLKEAGKEKEEFILNMDLNDFIKELSTKNIEYLEIKDVDLETEFINNYYEGDL